MRTALFNVIRDPKLVVLMIVLSQVVAIASRVWSLCIRGSRAPGSRCRRRCS